ncbi:MAG: cytochrome c biogenesis protein CcsA [Flavobacteriales bacterium]
MKMIIRHGYKVLAVLIMLYVIPMAWTGEVSVQVILHETIRNLYWHVVMWFAMILMFGVSVYYSVSHLVEPSEKKDIYALEFAHVGMMFGLAGIVTGMIWAQFTWGAPWTNDTKLNGSAASLLIYAAYFILRNSIQDKVKQERTAAVYNIFAFVMLLILVGIMPRLKETLHPGNGGNPGFGDYDDLKGSMAIVFRPAVLAWILIGVWIANIRIRIKTLQLKKEQW